MIINGLKDVGEYCIIREYEMREAMGHTGYSHRPPGCHGYEMRIMQSLARTFLAGKRLVTYVFQFADFWASSVFYLDTYTVNLELNDNFKVFYHRIYLYI